MLSAQRIAHAVRQAFNPPGLTLLQANGKEGDQTVGHFHMHVVPRHRDDGIELTWPRKNPAFDQLLEYAESLRFALR